MSTTIPKLRTELEQIREVLKEGTLLAHAPELNRSLSLGVDEMLRKADLQEERTLVVGLVGGTGVGKSSLTNALAGEPVASASHRRPHTDQVLVYRHLSSVLPSALAPGITPLREITHSAEAISQIVLCDMPDFDSMVSAHRRSVIEFMTHLDLLVWVVTPEKYADGEFYKFLQEVPKASVNFMFVLNKADLLFELVPTSEGYDRLSRVNALFAQHLAAHGIDSPVIHCVSAVQVLDGKGAAPWNQFPVFRSMLFQRREIKEIAAIKSANLDVEKRTLLRQLDEEVLRIRDFVAVLDRFMQEVERHRSDWREAGQRAIRRWVRGLPIERMAYRQSDPSLALAGPALLMAAAARRLGRSGPDEWRGAVGETRCVEPAGPLAGLHRELGRFSDRMTQRALQAGLPGTLIEDVRNRIDLEDRWVRLAGSLEEQSEALAAAQLVLPRKGFRFFQRLVYGTVYVLFVASLVRGELLSALVGAPSWPNLLRLCADLVLGLFRSTGVAALGSLAILQLFLGWRFFLRHKKWLQHRTQRFIETLEQELVRVWESELDEMVSACRSVAADKVTALERIERLRGAGRVD